MKFIKEDLANAMGLKVGDRIKVVGSDKTYRITDCYFFVNENDNIDSYFITNLIDEEYEILPPKKRLGDVKCHNIGNCLHCPLNALRCDRIPTDSNTTLYDSLETVCSDDTELYDFYKKRLDKEVED